MTASFLRVPAVIRSIANTHHSQTLWIHSVLRIHYTTAFFTFSKQSTDFVNKFVKKNSSTQNLVHSHLSSFKNKTL